MHLQERIAKDDLVIVLQKKINPLEQDSSSPHTF